MSQPPSLEERVYGFPARRPSVVVSQTLTTNTARLAIYAGPDRQNVRLCGVLTCLPVEAAAIAGALEKDGYEVRTAAS